MDQEQSQFERKRLIEEYGLLFEMEGAPRMVGRIIGYLMLSPSALVSSAELTEALQVTKGAISTTSRLLIQMELIERVNVIGDRRDYFRLKQRPWSHSFKRELHLYSAYRRIAEQGLQLMEDCTPDRKEALQEMYELYTFFENEFPALISRWEATWTKQRNSKKR